MGRPKRVIISVISDLVTDQRVNRTAFTLKEMGMEVTLVGRCLPDSLPVSDRPYAVHRFRLWKNKGPLFYALFNLRLFFFLLFKKADLLYANDLDTLPANFLIARLKGIKIIYDSHEYFTCVPELVNRPMVQSVWKKLERFLLPKVSEWITVNDSIAALYKKEYGKDFHVIRNVPTKRGVPTIAVKRSDWKIPEDKKVFLFQGAGINVDRGAEEAVEAISEMSDAVLLFIGGGDVTGSLKRVVDERKLSSKIFFIPKQPMDQLMAYTQLADFGLSLDKSNNLNYLYSLPNKLFDYIHAGLPVLVTALPEVERIVVQYDIGMTVSSPEPHLLSQAMEAMIRSPRIGEWKENLKFAAAELCWENEKKELIELVRNVID